MSAKNSDVYDLEAFSARVTYAEYCFLRGINSRRRDACFEMFDGEAVVVALLRRAENNPRLKNAIARGWSELRDGFPVSWMEHADRHAAIPTQELPVLAASLRAANTGGAK